MRRTGLSRRSQQSLLPPHMGNVLGWADLLRAEAEEGCWRIVEAYAEKGPIELDVGWSGGDGQGQTARLTVARVGCSGPRSRMRFGGRAAEGISPIFAGHTLEYRE